MHEHGEPSPLEAALRALLYLGSFGLVGGGLFSRWIGPELSRQRPRRLWGLLWAGALLVAGSSLYLAYHVARTLGSPEFFAPYLFETQQGNYLLLRLGLAALLLALGPGHPAPLQRLLHAGLGLAFLLTLSLTAHAGAKGGLALTADLAHLVASVSWGGGLLALALAWGPSPHTTSAVCRFSALALPAAGLFVGTGLLLAATHAGSVQPATLAQHDYGRTLLVKSALVLLILGLAAANRWVLLPQVRRRGPAAGLRAGVGLEALLLAGVLVTTGFLATTAPPERHPATLPSPGNPGVEVDAPLPQGRLSGRLQLDNLGLLHLTLELRDGSGNRVTSAPGFTLIALQNGTPPLRLAVPPASQGSYHAVLPLPRGGTWKLRLEFAGKALVYELEAPVE